MSLLSPGTILLKKYTVEGLEGEGTFAEVYRVIDKEKGGRFAAKVFNPDMPGMPTLNDQHFQLEVKLTQGLEHPNVIRTYDDGSENDLRVIILEYTGGETLKKKLKKEGPLPIQVAIQVILQICEGITAVQERAQATNLSDRLVHRDIKPANILFDSRGRAKIGDWGLAQTGTESMRTGLGSLAGSHPGTPLYKSPEHLNGAYLQPSADVYALGCVLYEALTGKHYKDQKKGTVPSQSNPDIPRWIDVIVKKATDEDPDKRYENSAEMAKAMRAGQRREKILKRMLTQGFLIFALLSITIGMMYGAYTFNRWRGGTDSTQSPNEIMISGVTLSPTRSTETLTADIEEKTATLPAFTLSPEIPTNFVTNTIQPTKIFTNTPLPFLPTNTPNPPPDTLEPFTDTPVPRTNTPRPTNTTLPPTSTTISPTNTPRPTPTAPTIPTDIPTDQPTATTEATPTAPPPPP